MRSKTACCGRLRAEGVTAIEVALGSSAERAGVQRGDVLLAVNGVPVERVADVVEYQHAGRAGTELTYTLIRLGSRQALAVSLEAANRSDSMYFVLAAVGLFTLLVGASVRLRRPRDQATLHFFWLCVAFFGAFTFSFNGPVRSSRLDVLLGGCGGDGAAAAVAPALHARLSRSVRRRNEPAVGVSSCPLMYVPAFLLGGARILAIVRGEGRGQLLSRALDLLDRAEPAYLFLCAAAASCAGASLR